MQRATSFHDFALALHIRATSLLLPLTERFDDDVAAMIQNVLATAFFDEQIMQINTLVISSTDQVCASDVHLKVWVQQMVILFGTWVRGSDCYRRSGRARAIVRRGGRVEPQLQAKIFPASQPCQQRDRLPVRALPSLFL